VFRHPTPNNPVGGFPGRIYPGLKKNAQTTTGTDRKYGNNPDVFHRCLLYTRKAGENALLLVLREDIVLYS
jgi:hypothetical protein